MSRTDLENWKRLGSSAADTENLSRRAVDVLSLTKERGASFLEEIVVGTGGLRSETEGASGKD